MSDTDAVLKAFQEHVDRLEEEYDVELSADERQTLLGHSIAGGFSPESTLEAFGELIADDEGFDDDEADDEPEADRLTRHVSDGLERAEAKAGRKLTAHERELAANGALRQLDRGEIVDIEEALDDHYAVTGEKRADTSTEAGRSEFYRQRMAETAEKPAELPDAVELDMTSPTDRATFYEQRAAGVEFEDSDRAAGE